MKTSDRGLAFLYTFEGFVEKPYNDDGSDVGDPNARGHCTIGIGHKIHDGPCDGRASEAPFASGISEAQAIALLRIDIVSYERTVDRLLRRPVAQHEYDALVDFTYNTGGGYPAVWSQVNHGRDICPILTITAILPAYATAALKRRRQRECRLYTYGDYGIIKPLPGGAIGDDEMWHRWNERAESPYWTDPALGGSPQFRHTFADGEKVTIQLGIDLPGVMGHGPSAIDIDLFERGGGGTLHVGDGDGGYAGRIEPADTSATIRVRPVNGAITLHAVNGPVTVGLGCLGYLD